MLEYLLNLELDNNFEVGDKQHILKSIFSPFQVK